MGAVVRPMATRVVVGRVVVVIVATHPRHDYKVHANYDDDREKDARKVATGGSARFVRTPLYGDIRNHIRRPHTHRMGGGHKNMTIACQLIFRRRNGHLRKDAK